MSKLDKTKEEIGWIKVFFSVLVAIDISLAAWLIQNFNRTNILLLIFSFIGIVVISFFIVRINKNVYKKIDELEDM